MINKHQLKIEAVKIGSFFTQGIIYLFNIGNK